jgi:hypothetical protein
VAQLLDEALAEAPARVLEGAPRGPDDRPTAP